MRFLFLLLAVCICTVHTSPINEDDVLEFDFRNQDYSFTVSMVFTKDHHVVKKCGGAQLGREWVITAAECLHNMEADTLTVTSSTHYNPKTFTPFSFNTQHLEFSVHPKYDEHTKANNLALIRFLYAGRQNVDRIPKMPSLVDAKNSFSQEQAAFSAVMKVDDPTNMSSFYSSYVQTKIVSQFWCKLSYFISVGNEHICASREAELIPEEFSTVGAPLVVKGDSEKSVKIVGIGSSITPWTSWVSLPRVFTRLTPFTDWIKEVTKISL